MYLKKLCYKYKLYIEPGLLAEQQWELYTVVNCHAIKKIYYKNFNTINTQRYFQIKLTGHNPISTQLRERERERECNNWNKKICMLFSFLFCASKIITKVANPQTSPVKIFRSNTFFCATNCYQLALTSPILPPIINFERFLMYEGMHIFLFSCCRRSIEST